MTANGQPSALGSALMAATVLTAAALALFFPATALWIPLAWINPLLMVVMFGMGMSLRPADFRPVLARPGCVALGCLAQFTVMPALAYLLCQAFSLDPALAVGVILVGACPGGTASNVITYLAKGDVALSVAMTSVNTLLAPLLTPAITYWMLQATVPVDAGVLLLAIVKVVVVPIALGFLVNHFFARQAALAGRWLPLVAVAAIATIVAAVVAHNAGTIMTAGAATFAVVALHNLLGIGAGFGLGLALRLPPAQAKALAVEIGMQNSGLATSLAMAAFPAMPLAAVPGCVFSVWHNMTGAALAAACGRWRGPGKASPAPGA